MTYEVHMVSFQADKSTGYSCIFRDGENLLPEHIEALEYFVLRMKAHLAKQDALSCEDLV